MGCPKERSLWRLLGSTIGASPPRCLDGACPKKKCKKPHAILRTWMKYERKDGTLTEYRRRRLGVLGGCSHTSLYGVCDHCRNAEESPLVDFSEYPVTETHTIPRWNKYDYTMDESCPVCKGDGELCADSKTRRQDCPNRHFFSFGNCGMTPCTEQCRYSETYVGEDRTYSNGGYDTPNPDPVSAERWNKGSWEA